MALDHADREDMRSAVADFLRRRADSERLRRYLEGAPGHDEELWSEATEGGFTAIVIPENLDGLGGGLADAAAIVRESGATLQLPALTTTLAALHVLASHGVLGENAQLLEAALSGAVFTYPHDLGLMAAAGETGVARLVADPTPGSLVVVPTVGGGVAVVSTDHADLRPRATFDLVRSFADLHFAHSAIIASVEHPSAAADLFAAAVALQSAESVGVASAALAQTVEYAMQREQFDRPIGSFQAIKHRLADMKMQVECAEVAAESAAESVDIGNDVRAAVATSGAIVGRAASWVVSQSQQVHGGIGFTWEHLLHLSIRRARTNELLLGEPRWHELQLASEFVTLQRT